MKRMASYADVADAGYIRDICLYLRDEPELGFDSLLLLSASDNNDKTLSVTYHLEAREAIVADCENYRHDRCQRQKTKWQSQPPRQRRASALTTRRDFLSATDDLPSTGAIFNCESQISSGIDSGKPPFAFALESGR